MKEYQKDAVLLLLENGALTFGDFTLKSGRKSPYFINTGRFDSGKALADLGALYARHLVETELAACDFIFGPAYKGIPLAVAAATALARDFGRDLAILYDRKESKDHGDAGKFVGRKLKDGDKIVIVEDVITAGTTMREIVPLLNSLARVEVRAVVVLVDRCERGSGNLSATEEIRQTMKIDVSPIVTIHDILRYVASPASGRFRLSSEMTASIEAYLQAYAGV
jgi:orotate phosphoribosyltransferase